MRSHRTYMQGLKLQTHLIVIKYASQQLAIASYVILIDTLYTINDADCKHMFHQQGLINFLTCN